MKLAQLRVRNFRCYKEEITVNFNDITSFIGCNDAGKSSIMDALDIFFNDTIPDKHDASKGDGRNPADLAIVCVFTDLPEKLILDQTEFTTLQGEYLLKNDRLEIHKIFNGGLDKPKLSALKLVADHPTAEGAADLIILNNAELKKRATEIGADTQDVDKKVNAQLRQAIRQKMGDLKLESAEISLLEGNGSSVWKGIQAELPAFALFKSDRASTDQDPEAQDPLNAAVKEAVKQKQHELDAITAHIKIEVKKIADLTLKKLKEMDPTLADALSPVFPDPQWAKLFKASITGDGDIPINKRGSGVRRLILLNFFRAKAEQLMGEQNKKNAIYAIEEPETSQHPRNQRLLVSALQELAGQDQVIITTHTPMLARVLPAESLRFINVKEDRNREILDGGTDGTNRLIATNLGILPDHNVKLFICVEGKHDIPFLKNMAKILITAGEDVPNLEQMELNGEIIFAPMGGSALALWCNRLQNLNRPELHIYDRDTLPPGAAKYQQYADQVNQREGCKAHITGKREIENYLHHEAINAALVEQQIPLTLLEPFGDFDDVPSLLLGKVNPLVPKKQWGSTRTKEFLCNMAASKMSKNLLDTVDADGEILGWFKDIKSMLVTAN